MPRKNHNANPKPLKRAIYTAPNKLKKRFPTKQAAQKAADEIMLMHPNVQLRIYQDIDLGWYLTSIS